MLDDAWCSAPPLRASDDTQSGSVSSVPPERPPSPIAAARRICRETTHTPACPAIVCTAIPKPLHTRTGLASRLPAYQHQACPRAPRSKHPPGLTHSQPHHVVGCCAATELAASTAVRRHQPARTIRNEPRRPAGLITAVLTASCSPPRNQCISPEHAATTSVRVDHFAPQPAQCNIAWHELLDVFPVLPRPGGTIISTTTVLATNADERCI